MEFILALTSPTGQLILYYNLFVGRMLILCYVFEEEV